MGVVKFSHINRLTSRKFGGMNTNILFSISYPYIPLCIAMINVHAFVLQKHICQKFKSGNHLIY